MKGRLENKIMTNIGKQVRKHTNKRGKIPDTIIIDADILKELKIEACRRGFGDLWDDNKLCGMKVIEIEDFGGFMIGNYTEVMW